MPHAGCYWPGEGAGRDSRIEHREATARGDRSVADRPVARRSSSTARSSRAASTAPIDALVAALAAEGIAALPIFVASLKDRDCEAFLAEAFAALPPAIVLNTTAFAVSRIGAAHAGTVLDRPGRPVLQVVLAGSSEAAWRESRRADLLPRDLTMNVVLPEVDGRLADARRLVQGGDASTR